MFKKISIFGLGLLGGSVCKALKHLDKSITISAYGRNLDKLLPAKEEGWVDHIDSLENALFHDTDLIIVSTPVIISVDIILEILNNKSLKKDTIIIDVSSVKNEIIERIKDNPKSGQFIGCHPMAGSEKMGFDHSRKDLYQKSSVIITPHDRNRENDIKNISGFWEKIGAHTIITTPDNHDRLVAYTSHLPHILSCVIVDVLKKSVLSHGDDESFKPFIGKGFKDVTRVSSGSPHMWHDITLLNKKHITEIIAEIIGVLKNLNSDLTKDEVDGEKILQFYSTIKQYRDGLL